VHERGEANITGKGSQHDAPKERRPVE
jgi:hypothetical protein